MFAFGAHFRVSISTRHNTQPLQRSSEYGERSTYVNSTQLGLHLAEEHGGRERRQGRDDHAGAVKHSKWGLA